MVAAQPLRRHLTYTNVSHLLAKAYHKVLGTGLNFRMPGSFAEKFLPNARSFEVLFCVVVYF